MRDVKDTETRPWPEIELEDDLDEELEQEIDDARVPPELRKLRTAGRARSIATSTSVSCFACRPSW